MSGNSPLRRPSSTTWRRERLLRIGSNPSVRGSLLTDDNQFPSLGQSAHESTALRTISTTATAGANHPSYGTLPFSRLRLPRKSHFRQRLPSLLDITLPSSRFFSASTPTSPLHTSPSYFRRLSQRPISAYDAPLGPNPDELDKEVETDAKTNGIRVWYSSFSSIDWLHDAIKDSVRFSRLRRRKSIRARIRLAIDKSIGWGIVTIVGFLTAVVAFLIVRSEQWLFDLKEGYCRENVWKAKRWCCPLQGENPVVGPHFHPTTEHCIAWRTWSEVFGPAAQGRWSDLEPVVGYIAYTVVAVSTGILISSLVVSEGFLII